MAVFRVVARGICVVVAAGTTMGMTVGLVVLITVVSARVPISTVSAVAATIGTAISAIFAYAVAATVGPDESSFNQRQSGLFSCEFCDGLRQMIKDGGVVCCNICHCNPVLSACLCEGGECL